MGSRTQPNKILLDIEDCVSELKRLSLDGKIPIDDDSAALHRFQEKLELIFLFGLIEKPGLLGPKKSYWNYICACFLSSKRSHDGINFVKSIAALKTSLGRGRAFIRFCLTQKCLADTLQSCFMDQKISRDFYTERSLPVQEKLWSALVTSLYELNELNFDLSVGHTELDISWPKFARELFTSTETEKFPHRNLSTPNLHNFTSQEEYCTIKCDSDSYSSFGREDLIMGTQFKGDLPRGGMTSMEGNADVSSSNSAMENLDALKLTEMNEELSQQNVSLKKEVKYLERERLRLETDIQTLQKECLSLQQQLSGSYQEKNSKIKAIEAGIESKDISTSICCTTDEALKNNLLKPVEEISASFSNGNGEEHSQSTSPSVKPKIKNDSAENYSECALQSNVDVCTTISNSYMSGKDSEDLQINRNVYLPQNSIYITELLLEIKTVIDDIEDTIQKSDVNLVIPHISRLKRIRNCLEEKFSSECDKSKSYLNFNNFVENCVSYIKSFTIKQENIINSLQEKVDLSIKGNQTLYSNIRTLKDLLRSYGFLKVVNEKDIEPKSILLPVDDGTSVSSKFYEDFSCDIAYDPVLKRIIVPLLPVLKSSFMKLSSLNEKMIELQFGLDSSQELNNNLITRVQDQEMHLKGVTKEIEEAQQLVSVLKKQHRKLQSAEGIFKYDLQEKRKLLTRLKQQLENTREDFNLVRIKNSKSEAEWQDLRKEFVQRHKQTSEESGFVDDKVFEEHETVFSTNSASDCNFSEVSTSEKESVSNNSTEIFQDIPVKKSRLELLEEQCQNLYSNLVQGSKKRQDIDRRLDTMCKTIERNNDMHPGSFNSDLPTENNFENANDAVVPTSSEDICQNIIFTRDTFTSSPHSSSDVGSLNSECSSCIPSMCNDANSSDSCYCDSSKTDSCISFSPCKLQIGAIQPLTTSEQINETNLLLDSDLASGCNSECKGVADVMISSNESVEITSNNPNSQLQSMSHVDSILIKKKDLEESLKNLESESEMESSTKMKYLQSEELSKQISALEEEKKHLLNKVQELEKRTLIISTELDRTTQQLIVSKAAKEHEVAALQFQLNTEALKYERALKEFGEQSKGLENMKQRVTDQEKLILALEEALLEIRSDRENEKEHQWQELEDIHIALEAREQECITLCQELEKSMTEVEEEQSRNDSLVSQLEEVKAYSQKDKEAMESEILQLKKYLRELQKKLVKLLKEKDILWKRSNHLYHLQKIKIDDRWMNDSEVSRCLGCKNNFSFMLRKHHCRLCGRIFCYSCSNNWLLTASSSKKIRVCNECFMQHMEMKKDVRRGSDVPHIEDDSEDEANVGLSYIPASSCSFNSEVPSSITDSIVSLPITQKQSTPHFASAPDLRYVFNKPREISSISISKELSEGKGENGPIGNDDSKYSEQNAEISSDECTSITLEEDIPKICRLKEISVDEINAFKDGLTGQFVINCGEKTDLPVICRTCPVILKWSFTSNYQDIPVAVAYTEENCVDARISYKATYMMQDKMKLSNPGYYVFHFDNTARFTEMKIQYIISTEHQTSELEESQHFSSNVL